MNRESGYYRVKLNDRWDIIYWSNGLRCFCWNSTYFHDSDFTEIDETPINPIPEKYREVKDDAN